MRGWEGVGGEAGRVYLGPAFVWKASVRRSGLTDYGAEGARGGGRGRGACVMSPY